MATIYIKSTLCSIFCLIYYRVVIKINLCQCQCTLGKWLIDFFYQYEYVVTQQTFSDEMASSRFRICVIVRIVTASYMNATSVSSRFRISDTGGILTMPTFVTDDAYSSPLRHVHVTFV